MNAAIYARFSSDNQRAESITAQMRACHEYCDRHSYKVVREYADEARSGRTDDRPQFQQMIRDAQCGLFQVLVVHKMDRFTRDRYDSAHYKRLLKKAGVQFISVLENLDGSPESVILESVIEGFSEYYSKNLAREVMKGMRESARDAKFLGGVPPIGYDIVSQQYVVNEREAEAVRRVFAAYLRGQSLRECANIFVELGVKSKRGNFPGIPALHEILRNRKYTGYYTFAEGRKGNHRDKRPECEMIIIPNGIPRIVDQDTWERVQEAMDRNKLRGNCGKKFKEGNLLSGIVVCGHCEAPMYIYKSTGLRGTYRYYRCKNCDCQGIRIEIVEKFLFEHVKQAFASTAVAHDLAVDLHNHAKKAVAHLSEQQRVIEKRLAEIKSQLEAAVDAILAGNGSTTLNTRMKALEDEQAALRKQLEASAPEIPSVELLEEFLTNLDAIDCIPRDKQKALLGVLFSKIKLFPVKKGESPDSVKIAAEAFPLSFNSLVAANGFEPLTLRV